MKVKRLRLRLSLSEKQHTNSGLRGLDTQGKRTHYHLSGCRPHIMSLTKSIGQLESVAISPEGRGCVFPMPTNAVLYDMPTEDFRDSSSDH